MSPDLEKKDTIEAIEKVTDPMATGSNGIQQMSDEEFHSVEKRLKRKLDIRLTAMIVFIYILNYLDRVRFSLAGNIVQTLTNDLQNNIAASKLAGIQDDLNMTPTQFSTAVSVLFVRCHVPQ